MMRIATLPRRIAFIHRRFHPSSSSFLRYFSSPRKYTEDHEWVHPLGDGTAKVGISDYAQHALGDVVYVELPSVGTTFAQKEQLGAVESVKAASDIYAPVSGEVIEVNSHLEKKPGTVNRSPYDEGYLCTMKLTHPEELEGLMDDAAYETYTNE